MLVFNSVSKTYPGGITSLKEVTTTINPGEFVFLVGPSGAGKTTLIRLLIQEERPSAGSILFEDADITNLSRHQIPYWRRQVGVVFQDYRLLPTKTAFENIALALRVVGKREGEIKKIVPSLLKTVGLAGREDYFPCQFSGGQQQRLAIARAISHNPRIVIADEPVGNLDQATAAGIMSLLEDINRWGTTVLVATHDRPKMDKGKVRVLGLEDGVLTE